MVQVIPRFLVASLFCFQSLLCFAESCLCRSLDIALQYQEHHHDKAFIPPGLPQDLGGLSSAFLGMLPATLRAILHLRLFLLKEGRLKTYIYKNLALPLT